METTGIAKAFSQKLSNILTGSGVPWDAVRPIAEDEALVVTDDFSKTEDFLWSFGFATDWVDEGLKVKKQLGGEVQ